MTEESGVEHGDRPSPRWVAGTCPRGAACAKRANQGQLLGLLKNSVIAGASLIGVIVHPRWRVLPE